MLTVIRFWRRRMAGADEVCSKRRTRRAPSHLLVAVVTMLWAVAAAAGGLTGPPGGKASGPVTLRADHQEWIKKNKWHGSGHVEILYQDIKITCDDVEFNNDTMELVAHGHVIMDQGPRRFTASKLTYNLKTKTGKFIDATGQAAPEYYFTGKEVDKLDATHFKLFDATFTSCSAEPRPPWRFKIHRATIEEEGYGSFHGVSLQVKGVPVFYLPYLLWPVKTERTSGLLVPTFGYSNQRGMYLGNALYLALARSYDTTIYLDTYSQGWFGIGNQWRWAPKEHARGDVTGYVVRDPDTRQTQWKIDGKYHQDDFFGFRLVSELHDMSDLDFFREYEHTFNRNTLRSLYSYIYLTRAWGPYNLNIRMDRRKTYLTSSEIILQQLPELELRVRPTRIGQTSLFWSLVSSANLFNVDRGGLLSGTYERLDAHPQLSYTLPSPPWLSITPRVGVRSTYYTKSYNAQHTAFADQSLTRSYVEAGLDIVGPSFSRIIDHSWGPFTKFKHLIEPRIEYTYVSDPGDISRIPRFDEVDSTLVTNKMRLSIANRLFGRMKKSETARELGSFIVYQDYSFSEPLDFSFDRKQSSRRGPLGGILRITPVQGVYVEARAEFDTLFHNLRSDSLSASMYQKGKFLNFTWYQGYIPQTGKRTSSQIRTSFGFSGANRPLQLRVNLSYDAQQSKFLQQRIVARYQGSCWGLTLEYRDLEFANYPAKDVRISVDFKGLGRLLDIRTGLENE